MGVVSHSQEPAGILAPNHKTDEEEGEDGDNDEGGNEHYYDKKGNFGSNCNACHGNNL